MDHRPGDGQRAAPCPAAVAHRARNLRTVPCACGRVVRRLAPGAFPVRHPPCRSARTGALLRRWPDRGRGLRIRLVPPEQDVFEGGDDCHEPHSLKLRVSGDGVCLQCHSAAKYETATHRFHDKVSPPIACISCHMPTRTYMVVHVRHDHSLRIPRPDRSARLGTPNACNACHRDKSPQSAADAIAHWYGPERKGFQNFADALHTARAELQDSDALLHQVVNDPQTPGIAIATAYAGMPRYLTPALVDLKHGLADPDPLVRIGTLRGLDGIAPDQRWAFASALLTDPALAVRIQAASL